MAGKRLLIANVHFAPFSYGGATIVAENLASILSRDYQWKILVVTTFNDPTLAPYVIKRHRAKGLDIIAINIIYSKISFEEGYANPKFDRIMRLILSVYQPDVAHIHCVQMMGATFFKDLQQARIPFAVTAHDCWWFCERQFMLNASQHYCHQTKIDLDVCRFCVGELGRSRERLRVLTAELGRADRILFPSSFFRDLYVENGYDADACLVNKNGVQMPGPGYAKKPGNSPGTITRLGFVGGPGPIKGAPQILKALRDLDRKDYEFVVVDALQNLGGSWQKNYDWSVPGEVRFRPGYAASGMDDFFAEIDVLLFPSQWKESFGLVVREAMLRDVWVIATDAGGVAEDCTHGINSTIIPMSPDHHPLKLAIEEVLDRRDWSSYRNPNATEIVTIDQQAGELSSYLNEIA